MEEYWSQSSSEAESTCHQVSENNWTYSSPLQNSSESTTGNNMGSNYDFQTSQYPTNQYSNNQCSYQNNQIFEQDSCYSSSSSEIEEKPEFEDFSSSSFSPNPEKESDFMENSQNHPVLNGNFKTKWQRKRAYEMTLPLHIRQKRRSAANARERKRMTNLNDAFEKLRGILPNHHRDRPLSKMEALQLAQNYIKELTSTLETENTFVVDSNSVPLPNFYY
jgi:hypothetical protein